MELAGDASTEERRRQESTMTESEIDEVLRRHADALLAVPGVAGAGRGVCGGDPCVRVWVERRTPELERRISQLLPGVPLEIDETGSFRAVPDPGRGGA